MLTFVIATHKTYLFTLGQSVAFKAGDCKHGHCKLVDCKLVAN